MSDKPKIGRPQEITDGVRLNLFVPGETRKKLDFIRKKRSAKSLVKVVVALVDEEFERSE